MVVYAQAPVATTQRRKVLRLLVDFMSTIRSCTRVRIQTHTQYSAARVDLN